MLVAMVSAKGAPGVSTAALALAAASAATGSLVVEADPAGGDLECWCGPLGEPGLLNVATDLASEADAESIWEHTVDAAPGIRAVTSPTTLPGSTAALVPLVDRLGPALTTLDATVVLDCGRWAVSHRCARHVAAAAVVLVVCRPTLDSVEHARDLIDSLRPVNRAVAALVVGGTHPYGPDEVAGALGVPVAGVLPWDPRGVLALVESGVGRAWSRNALGKAAPAVLAGIARIVEETWADA
jgi:MinD-like ATPase involved in chromosome partitioning or flagellar assembly